MVKKLRATTSACYIEIHDATSSVLKGLSCVSNSSDYVSFVKKSKIHLIADIIIDKKIDQAH